jgi:hypothetical protein
VLQADAKGPALQKKREKRTTEPVLKSLPMMMMRLVDMIHRGRRSVAAASAGRVDRK